jgi:hypothetical protein
MNIRDAVKTTSKIFKYIMDVDETGFISNGTWITWTFNYDEETLMGRADQELNLELEPKWHEVTEGKPEEYHKLIEFIFKPDILIEK